MKENILAIPSKGKFKDESIALLSKGGINADFNGRQLTTETTLPETKDWLTVALMRPKDIVNLVALGRIPVGIVGRDSLWEYYLKEGNLATPDQTELLSAKLPEIGICRMVLAVPDWQELPKIRRSTGEMKPERRRPFLEQLRGKRIATSYPLIAKEMLDPDGEFQFTWEELGGCVEAAPKIGLADAIVDLVETGKSRKENGLKEVFTIFRSFGLLITSRLALRENRKFVIELTQRLA